MSDMKAFEIHTFQSGKWKIDSVFDDRDLALFEAQRMDESGRYTGIRVIEEIYVESTQETKTRTIFRGSKVEQANAEQLQKAKQTRANAARAKKKPQGDVAQRKAAAKRRKVKKKSNPVRLIVITLIIAIAAGGAMFGLQFAQGM
ncbi:MAG: hypothetical protein EBU57_10195 [Alphaproteobacteria bacterium]|nr:hypothetical protein [Alphaproteobacteria bacterium]